MRERSRSGRGERKITDEQAGEMSRRRENEKEAERKGSGAV